MIRFESPLAFLVLLIVPILLWQSHRRRGGGPSIRFSSIVNAVRAGQSVRQIFAGLPEFLRLVALVLLAVALARPQMGKEQVRDVSQGIAIAMVLDRSSSMEAEMEYGGELMSRLDVAKNVFARFVQGDGKKLAGRPNDLVGMVAFARYADTICPLTLGHDALEHFLDTVKLVSRRSEDGTAIGDAVALAAARLKTAEETLARQMDRETEGYDIKSKVIILLTDGENNCGERSIEQAADLAAEWGIKVYTIGIGGGESVRVMKTILGSFKMPGLPNQVDERALGLLAERTGGRFRMADDASSLTSVYSEIDKMERSEVESVRFMDYRELFGPFALAALCILAAEVVLASTVFRRIP